MNWREDVAEAPENFVVLVGWEDGDWTIAARWKDGGFRQPGGMGAQMLPQPQFWAEVKRPNQ